MALEYCDNRERPDASRFQRSLVLLIKKQSNVPKTPHLATVGNCQASSRASR